MLKSLLLLLCVFLTTTFAFTSENKYPGYTKKDILAYLDHIEKYGFPSDESRRRASPEWLQNMQKDDEEGTTASFLEPPYTKPSGSRITLFADKTRWAIVLELTGFDQNNSSIPIEFIYLGNCVTKEWTAIDLVYPVDIPDEWPIPANYVSLKVRGKDIPIEHDSTKYVARSIDLSLPGIAGLSEMTRYMDETNHELFRATEAELRQGLPSDLPMLMHIDHWYQKPIEWVPIGERESEMVVTPLSSYETYRMIADILVTRDISRWKPTLKPNNDWRNWPEAGSM